MLEDGADDQLAALRAQLQHTRDEAQQQQERASQLQAQAHAVKEQSTARASSLASAKGSGALGVDSFGNHIEPSMETLMRSATGSRTADEVVTSTPHFAMAPDAASSVDRLQAALSRITASSDRDLPQPAAGSSTWSDSVRLHSTATAIPAEVLTRVATLRNSSRQHRPALSAQREEASACVDAWQAEASAAREAASALLQQQERIAADAQHASAQPDGQHVAAAMQAQALELASAAKALQDTAHRRQGSAAALAELLRGLQDDDETEAAAHTPAAEQTAASISAVLSSAQEEMAAVHATATAALDAARASDAAADAETRQRADARQRASKAQEAALAMTARGDHSGAAAAFEQARALVAQDASPRQLAGAVSRLAEAATDAVAAAELQLRDAHTLRLQALDGDVARADTSTHEWRSSVEIARQLMADMSASAREKSAAAQEAAQKAAEAALRAAELTAQGRFEEASEVEAERTRWQETSDKLAAEAAAAAQQCTTHEQTARDASVQLEGADELRAALARARAGLELDHTASLLQLAELRADAVHRERDAANTAHQELNVATTGLGGLMDRLRAAGAAAEADGRTQEARSINELLTANEGVLTSMREAGDSAWKDSQRLEQVRVRSRV